MPQHLFTGVFLAPADDLSNTLYLYSATTVTGHKTKPGNIQRYAGGRTRAVTQVGMTQTVDVSAEHQPRVTREQLESWVGTLLLYRDGRGRCFTGMYFSLDCPEELPQDWCSFSFTFTEVTHSLAA